MLENPPPKTRLTQEEYDVKCLNAMMACNWSFEQFNDVSFRELLNIGHEFDIPTLKVIKAQLKKYIKLVQNEIKQCLMNNESRISSALDCWSSSN